MSILDNVFRAVQHAALTWFSRSRLSPLEGEIEATGLTEPVEIIRDRWGVPHIYARNTRDMLFAQGYVHAQDRLWQMEFQRRLVAGRLSEVLGPVTEQVDRWIRTLTMRRVAEQEVPLLKAPVRADLDSYVAGINAFIARGRLPVEFALLRYQPEPWTLVDSLSWNKMISWSLSVNWETEILRAQLIAALGPEKAAELEPAYFEHWPRVLPAGLDYSTIGARAYEIAEAARPFTGPAALDGLGSNNWVLAGSRTTTGKPLLANDMHLPMTLPCIWYENHLVAPVAQGDRKYRAGRQDEWNISGITFPGVPSIIVGHNNYVAWGFTNGFPDVQDLYVERLRRTGDGRVQYEFKGEWRDAEVFREEIGIKGRPSVVQEVIVTRHGPIINELAAKEAGEQPLALRWTSLEPDTMIYALYGMSRARTCLEFRRALRHWTAPVQNMVYADTQGNIGYSFPGKVPIRSQGDGTIPVPGWTGEYEWEGYIPFHELPHLYNPPTGYVATANNCVTPQDYPHCITCDYTIGDRAQRIVELVEARDKIDIAYIQKMQFDLVSTTARDIACHIGEMHVDEPDLAGIVQMMRDWDGGLRATSAEAAIYEVFGRHLVHRVFSDKLGDLTDRFAGKGPTPLLAEFSMFAVRAAEWMLETLPKAESHWFDLGHGETRDEVMRLALRETVDFLKSELGPDITNWSWGKLHTLTYRHVLGQSGALEDLFNRGPFPVGGDYTTLWAAGGNVYDLKSDPIIGPPFRFIADLGDLRNSCGLLAPGQSGQPGSRHYDDQVEAWFTGAYHPMLSAREDVEREAAARLRLVPRQEHGRTA